MILRFTNTKTGFDTSLKNRKSLGYLDKSNFERTKILQENTQNIRVE